MSGFEAVVVDVGWHATILIALVLAGLAARWVMRYGDPGPRSRDLAPVAKSPDTAEEFDQRIRRATGRR
jgi:hypothetical protein